MEGENFTLPGTRRLPSLFAASAMFFAAIAGKPVIDIVETGLVFLMRKAGMSYNASLLDMTLTIAYYLCFVVLPFFLYALRHPGTGEYARLKPLGIGTAVIGVLAGIAGFYMCAYTNSLWQMLIELWGGRLSDTGDIKMDTASQIVSQVAFTSIMPALCEEALFRGALLSAWEEKGSVRAIFITAALFTLMHSRIEGIPAQFISGVVLGCLVVASGSLFTGIIYHTVYNAVTLVYSAIPAEEEAASASLYEAVGGAAGVTMIALYIIISLLTVYWLIRLAHRLHGGGAFGVKPIRADEKGACEWIVISCGIILALMLYVPGILNIAGRLK